MVFTHKVDKETLSVEILPDNVRKASFASIHGAGQSDKHRIDVILDDLLKNGLSILRFDQSGHGGSTGKLSGSSLSKRVAEASEIIENYADLDNLILCGSSMGGYVAIKLLNQFNPKTLVLFAPSIFIPEAYEVNFTEEFTKIIRKPESWAKSDALEDVSRFKGRLLIITGTEDQVIPKRVIELIYENAENASRKEVFELQGFTHKLFKELSEKPDAKSQVIRKILEFI